MAATSWLDAANDLTNRGAEWLRDVIDRVVAGEQQAAEELRPFAEQLDGLFSDADNPIPDPPEGGIVPNFGS